MRLAAILLLPVLRGPECGNSGRRGSPWQHSHPSQPSRVPRRPSNTQRSSRSAAGERLGLRAAAMAADDVKEEQDYKLELAHKASGTDPRQREASLRPPLTSRPLPRAEVPVPHPGCDRRGPLQAAARNSGPGAAARWAVAAGGWQQPCSCTDLHCCCTCLRADGWQHGQLALPHMLPLLPSLLARVLPPPCAATAAHLPLLPSPPPHIPCTLLPTPQPWRPSMRRCARSWGAAWTARGWL